MSTALRTYFRGHNLVSIRDDAAGKMAYYHFDHQGTTQCLSDSTGAVTDRFASDAWGVQVKRTGSSINRAWYIGNLGYVRQVDQDLDHVRRRYYSYLLARWMSKDPLSSRRVDHLFRYVLNGPTLGGDASGLASNWSCSGSPAVTLTDLFARGPDAITITAGPACVLAAVASVKLSATATCSGDKSFFPGPHMTCLWQWVRVTVFDLDLPIQTVPIHVMGYVAMDWHLDGGNQNYMTCITSRPPANPQLHIANYTMIGCDSPGDWVQQEMKPADTQHLLPNCAPPVGNYPYYWPASTCFLPDGTIKSGKVVMDYATGVGESPKTALQNAKTWRVEIGMGIKAMNPLGGGKAYAIYGPGGARPPSSAAPSGMTCSDFFPPDSSFGTPCY